MARGRAFHAMPAKLQQGITTTDCPVERVAKMKPTFVEEYARELQRLRTLVNQLTDLDSKLTVGDRWTVSTLLAHLAFWNYRGTGVVKPVEESGQWFVVL